MFQPKLKATAETQRPRRAQRVEVGTMDLVCSDHPRSDDASALSSATSAASASLRLPWKNASAYSPALVSAAAGMRTGAGPANFCERLTFTHC